MAILANFAKAIVRQSGQKMAEFKAKFKRVKKQL